MNYVLKNVVYSFSSNLYILRPITLILQMNIPF